MQNHIRIYRIAITFAFLLLLFAAFTLYYGLANTASAPFSIIGGDFQPDDDIDPSSPSRFPHPSDTPISTHTPSPTQDPLNSDYILLRMSPLDISRGSLVLVNSNHGFELPEDNDLIIITSLVSQSYSIETSNAMLSFMVIDPLNEMMDSFYQETGNSSMTIRGAHRSRAAQQQIYEHYVRLVGYSEAQKWASLPGHSEHQTGLAVDFGRSSGGETYTFTGTGIFSWFNENCHRFGFILRYPPDKTDITQTNYEPWHYRFVGIPHAYIMYANNWSLEEYVEALISYSRDEPYAIIYEGFAYEIFFTDDTEIRLPYDSEFDISGNNIDGFIVTVKRQT